MKGKSKDFEKMWGQFMDFLKNSPRRIFQYKNLIYLGIENKYDVVT